MKLLPLLLLALLATPLGGILPAAAQPAADPPVLSPAQTSDSLESYPAYPGLPPPPPTGVLLVNERGRDAHRAANETGSAAWSGVEDATQPARHEAATEGALVVFRDDVGADGGFGGFGEWTIYGDRDWWARPAARHTGLEGIELSKADGSYPAQQSTMLLSPELDLRTGLPESVAVQAYSDLDASGLVNALLEDLRPTVKGALRQIIDALNGLDPRVAVPDPSDSGDPVVDELSEQGTETLDGATPRMQAAFAYRFAFDMRTNLQDGVDGMQIWAFTRKPASLPESCSEAEGCQVLQPDVPYDGETRTFPDKAYTGSHPWTRVSVDIVGYAQKSVWIAAVFRSAACPLGCFDVPGVFDPAADFRGVHLDAFQAQVETVPHSVRLRPLAEPSLRPEGRLGVTLAPGEPIPVIAEVANLGKFSEAFDLTVELRDGAGVLVQRLGPQRIELAPGHTRPIPGMLDALEDGHYTLHAALSGLQGDLNEGDNVVDLAFDVERIESVRLVSIDASALQVHATDPLEYVAVVANRGNVAVDALVTPHLYDVTDNVTRGRPMTLVDGYLDDPSPKQLHLVPGTGAGSLAALRWAVATAAPGQVQLEVALQAPLVVGLAVQRGPAVGIDRAPPPLFYHDDPLQAPRGRILGSDWTREGQILGAVSSGAAPLVITFEMSADDLDGRIAGYSLDFGDGSPLLEGPGRPPVQESHTYTKVGTYVAILTVHDDEGSESSASMAVGVTSQPPLATLTANRTTGNAPLGVRFTVGAGDTDGQVTGFSLDFGDGTPVVAGAGVPPSTIDHVYARFGSFTARLAVRDNAGLETADTEQIQPGTNGPEVDLQVDIGSGQVPLHVNFTLEATDADGIGDHSLDFGDGSPPLAGTGPPPGEVHHVYRQGGAFTARLIVHDGVGATGSHTQLVTVQNDAPQVSLEANATAGYAPLHVNFTLAASDTEGDLAEFSLDFGDGTPPVEGEGVPPGWVLHTYTAAGVFVPTLEVNDTAGGHTVATASIAVRNQAPRATVTATPSAGSLPLIVQFNLMASDADGEVANFTLDFGDGTPVLESTGSPPSIAVHAYTTAGQFLARLTVHDNEGALGRGQAKVTVLGQVNQNPAAALAATPNAGPSPLAVDFTASASDPDGTIADYELDFGDGRPSAAGAGPPPSSVAHVYSAAGTYDALLTVHDDRGATAMSNARIIVAAPANLPPVAHLAPTGQAWHIGSDYYLDPGVVHYMGLPAPFSCKGNLVDLEGCRPFATIRQPGVIGRPSEASLLTPPIFIDPGAASPTLVFEHQFATNVVMFGCNVFEHTCQPPVEIFVRGSAFLRGRLGTLNDQGTIDWEGWLQLNSQTTPVMRGTDGEKTIGVYDAEHGPRWYARNNQLSNPDTYCFDGVPCQWWWPNGRSLMFQGPGDEYPTLHDFGAGSPWLVEQVPLSDTEHGAGSPVAFDARGRFFQAEFAFALAGSAANDGGMVGPASEGWRIGAVAVLPTPNLQSDLALESFESLTPYDADAIGLGPGTTVRFEVQAANHGALDASGVQVLLEALDGDGEVRGSGTATIATLKAGRSGNATVAWAVPVPEPGEEGLALRLRATLATAAGLAEDFPGDNVLWSPQAFRVQAHRDLAAVAEVLPSSGGLDTLRVLGVAIENRGNVRMEPEGDDIPIVTRSLERLTGVGQPKSLGTETWRVLRGIAPGERVDLSDPTLTVQDLEGNAPDMASELLFQPRVSGAYRQVVRVSLPGGADGNASNDLITAPFAVTATLYNDRIDKPAQRDPLVVKGLPSLNGTPVWQPDAGGAKGSPLRLVAGDPERGELPAHTDGSYVLPPLDLTSVKRATLTFAHRFDLEAGFDAARVEISLNGGQTWEPCSRAPTQGTACRLATRRRRCCRTSCSRMAASRLPAPSTRATPASCRPLVSARAGRLQNLPSATTLACNAMSPSTRSPWLGSRASLAPSRRGLPRCASAKATSWASPQSSSLTPRGRSRKRAPPMPNATGGSTTRPTSARCPAPPPCGGAAASGTTRARSTSTSTTRRRPQERCPGGSGAPAGATATG
ncbi:MAG: PKD domain-containing protein [Candidatus Thermoplasmatota archaeon]|jgi:PKD repeat protein